MVPQGGPLPAFQGHDVWALGLYRVYKGYIRRPLSRVHTKGPCNYPKVLGPKP